MDAWMYVYKSTLQGEERDGWDREPLHCAALHAAHTNCSTKTGMAQHSKHSRDRG